MMPQEGDTAPPFKALDAQGKEHALADYRGTFILYFYPKDDTPGCTIEACELTKDYSEFQRFKVPILGVSPDDAISHQRFAQKFKIPFPLLVDQSHSVAKAYGAWGEKSFMGKKYMGINRSTFIIKDGKIAKAFPKVTPLGHSKELLLFLAQQH